MSDAEQQQQRASAGEEEPLLGGAGDASQQQKPLYHNLVIGKLFSRLAVLRQQHGSDSEVRHRRRRASGSMDSGSYCMGQCVQPRLDAVLCASGTFST